ncbi:MAG: gamma-glutamylcyclotransferase family protein [Actinomycetota bacterium]
MGAGVPAETALAVYGSLRPGEPNHWVVNRIRGEWRPGTVRGWAFEITWGPAEGFDGFIPDADGAQIDVDVLFSEELPKKWREIDDFEGAGYERKVVEVRLDDGSLLKASAYVALTEVD